MSRTIFKSLLAAALALSSLYSCKGRVSATEPAAAPVLVSVSPEDGATEIKGGKIELVFSFDQNIKSSVASPEMLNVTGGEYSVRKFVAYNKTLTIGLEELEEGKSYSVKLPAGIVSGFKDNPTDREYSSSFSTWKELEVVSVGRNPAKSLHNPNASVEAKALYSFILNNYGSKSLSGAMASGAWATDFYDYLAQQTSKYPAVIGFDYIFEHWGAQSWYGDYSDISKIKEYTSKGNVVQICWHMNVPERDAETDPNKFHFYNDDFKKASIPIFSAAQAVRQGTWQNKSMNGQIDRVAGYLKILQDEGIPVLFRPFHEAAGDYKWGSWFWWGADGADACKALYIYLHDKLTNEYGLNNLVWVWTVQTKEEGKYVKDLNKVKDWYPGDNYVDIVGADLYEPKGADMSEAFKIVNASVDGKKIVALSEFGNLPNFDREFASDAPWAYYMVWTSSDNNQPVLYNKNADGTYGWNNTAEEWKAALNNAHTINRDAVPSFK